MLTAKENFLQNIIRIKRKVEPDILCKSDILSQRLKYNNNILIGKTPIIKLDGLNTVADIFDSVNNVFFSYDEVNRRSGIAIHKFNQIKSVIHKRWGRYLKTNEITQAHMILLLEPHG